MCLFLSPNRETSAVVACASSLEKKELIRDYILERGLEIVKARARSLTPTSCDSLLLFPFR